MKKITVISDLRLKIKSPIKATTRIAVQYNESIKFCTWAMCRMLRIQVGVSYCF